MKLESLELLKKEKENLELQKRKERYEEYLRSQAHAQSSSGMKSRRGLLIGLRRQVQEISRENYCQQIKVNRDQLEQRLTISESCRKLIELLKEESACRDRVETEMRRKKYE